MIVMMKGHYGPGVLTELSTAEEEGEIDYEHLEEDKTQNNAQSGPYGGGRQRYGGQKAGTSYANSAVRGESRKSRKPISE